MDKLKLHSTDLTQANICKLAALFPHCVTESRDDEGVVRRVIDFDQLRQELSPAIVEGPQERYQLNWPGKREALLLANAPIAKTLRPCREESVNFDSTRNLFIEGDNLDALKLLQETYLNKVKMIYIDPPYNTGNDFIYEDDFKLDNTTYLLSSNQVDASGGRLSANPETKGRYHSDWLSMMYSRLRLARNLLKEDGAVFISIDDKEVDNLKKICDEIFGEDSFLGRVVWKNATDNNPTNIAVEHEYVLVFCRSRLHIEAVWKSAISDVKKVLMAKGKDLIAGYPDHELQERYSEWFRENKAQLWPLDGYKFIDSGGVYAGIRGVHNPGREGYRYEVKHPTTGKPCIQPLMGYRFPWDTMKRLISEGRIIFGDDHSKLIELKAYAQDYQEKLSSVMELDGRSGAYDVRALFPEYRTAFDNPKPIKLLQRFISLVTRGNDIVLDFFAGSATTAHAVLDLNSKDGHARRFVLVQIAEECDENSEAARSGIKSIAQLSQERIRRAISTFDAANTQEMDLGFRCLKIDTSNMTDVYYTPDAITQDLISDQIDNIRADRTPEDLLFQVLLDWGVDLGLPISRETLAGKSVFFVDGNALAACFDTGIDEAFVKLLAKREPVRAVFRDAGFASDSVKINVEQIFRLMSPGTEVKTI